MAFSKASSFPEIDQRLADAAKALCHPARLAILRTLAARNDCICGDLVAELPLAQSTVSQHLRVLREAGLVKGEIEGPKSCYCLDRTAVGALLGDLAALLQTLERSVPVATPCCTPPNVS